MKQQIISAVAAVLVLATTATATTMSSPNYTSISGRIVSGGSAATDVSGMTKAGIAIGQAVFMPPGGSSSPAYTSKTVTLPSIVSTSGGTGGSGGTISSGGAAVAGGIIAISTSNGLQHTGDINGDGVVDIVDALLALKAGSGQIQLSSDELFRGDVGPLVNGVAVGDGRIDIEDAILILRKAVGLGW